MKLTPTHAQIIAEQIDNYHRIVMESVSLVLNTKNENTRSTRYTLAMVNIEKLHKLKRYATGEQKKLIKEAQRAVYELQRFMHRS